MARICLPALVALALVVAGRTAAAEDVWHAVRSLAPGDIVRSEDVTPQAPFGRVRNAMPSAAAIVGLEVKRRIYAGRDIAQTEVGAITAVKASTMVTVLWKSGDLSLELQGRALEAGAIGDEIRILNPTSLRTIRGTVVGESMVEVKSAQ
ncbi:MAG: flagellar basal body P-ring formation chaperone FlgA [Rhodopila sp.]